MTLSEFYNMAFSTSTEPVTAYVFDDDGTRDEYRSDARNGEILFVLKSHYEAKSFLNEKYANVKVQSFYAIGENLFDVVVDLEAGKCG